MADNVLFETSYLGSKVKVFGNRVEWRMLLTRKTIPINQIASVELGIPLYAKVTIETAGGRKFGIPVAPGKKRALQDAIFSAQAK